MKTIETAFIEAIKSIPNNEKKGYLKALAFCPELLHRESCVQRFLSTQDGKNVDKAARKFVEYWDRRVDAFRRGGDAFRPLTLSDPRLLDETCKAALRAGWVATLPPDKFGRRVCLLNLAVEHGWPHFLSQQDKSRCIFYVLQCLSEETSAQTQGVTLIVVYDNSSDTSSPMESIKALEETCQAMPFQVKSLHVIAQQKLQADKAFYDDFLSVALKTLIDANQNEDHDSILEHSSYVYVDQSKESILQALERHGLARENLPVALGGSWTSEHFGARLKLRLDHERRQASLADDNGGSTTTADGIIFPDENATTVDGPGSGRDAWHSKLKRARKRCRRRAVELHLEHLENQKLNLQATGDFLEQALADAKRLVAMTEQNMRENGTSDISRPGVVLLRPAASNGMHSTSFASLLSEQESTRLPKRDEIQHLPLLSMQQSVHVGEQGLTVTNASSPAPANRSEYVHHLNHSTSLGLSRKAPPGGNLPIPESLAINHIAGDLEQRALLAREFETKMSPGDLQTHDDSYFRGKRSPCPEDEDSSEEALMVRQVSKKRKTSSPSSSTQRLDNVMQLPQALSAPRSIVRDGLPFSVQLDSSNGPRIVASDVRPVLTQESVWSDLLQSQYHALALRQTIEDPRIAMMMEQDKQHPRLPLDLDPRTSRSRIPVVASLQPHDEHARLVDRALQEEERRLLAAARSIRESRSALMPRTTTRPSEFLRDNHLHQLHSSASRLPIFSENGYLLARANQDYRSDFLPHIPPRPSEGALDGHFYHQRNRSLASLLPGTGGSISQRAPLLSQLDMHSPTSLVTMGEGGNLVHLHPSLVRHVDVASAHGSLSHPRTRF